MDRLNLLSEIIKNLEYMNKWSASSLMKFVGGALDEVTMENFQAIKDQTYRIFELIEKLDSYLVQATEKNARQAI